MNQKTVEKLEKRRLARSQKAALQRIREEEGLCALPQSQMLADDYPLPGPRVYSQDGEMAYIDELTDNEGNF